MRFYLQISHYQPAVILELGPLVEELGWDGVGLADHVANPDPVPSTYPYRADGTPPFRVDTPWPDVWVVAGALSQLTSRIELMTNVYLLALRHPLHAARAIGTAATLSGGRVALGIGIGWLAEEFAAVGVDFAARGRITDESIGALRALWRGGAAEFHGKYVDFAPVVMEPAPPRVPILVGGKSAPALRRAALLGDGYIAATFDPGEVAATKARLLALRADGERAGEPFDFHGRALPSAGLADYHRLVDAGVDAFTVRLVSRPDSPSAVLRAELERFTETIVQPLRKERLG